MVTLKEAGSKHKETPFDRVKETDPNNALKSLHETSESLIDEWLKDENLYEPNSIFGDLLTDDGKKFAAPRFFGARTVEQKVFQATMSALDAASREIYGDGFDLEVHEWDEGYNSNQPNNRIVAEPTVLITESRKEDLKLNEDRVSELDNLEIHKVGSDGYLVEAFNGSNEKYSLVEENMKFSNLELGKEQREPVIIAEALGVDFSETETPLDIITESSPLPRKGERMENIQANLLEYLFNQDQYPDVLKLDQGEEGVQWIRKDGNSYETKSGKHIPEEEAIGRGLLTPREVYDFVIPTNVLSGTNYVWNGGWPKDEKFRSERSRNLLELAEENSTPIRIPSIGKLESYIPEELKDETLTTRYSKVADTPRKKAEAFGNLLISDEVMIEDLVAEYSQEIVRASEEEDYQADPLPEYSRKVVERISETYGVDP